MVQIFNPLVALLQFFKVCVQVVKYKQNWTVAGPTEGVQWVSCQSLWHVICIYIYYCYASSKTCSWPAVKPGTGWPERGHIPMGNANGDIYKTLTCERKESDSIRTETWDRDRLSFMSTPAQLHGTSRSLWNLKMGTVIGLFLYICILMQVLTVFYFSYAGYKNKPQDGDANCAFTLELGMVANSTEMCEMNFRIPCLPCNVPIRGKWISRMPYLYLCVRHSGSVLNCRSGVQYLVFSSMIEAFFSSW